MRTRMDVARYAFAVLVFVLMTVSGMQLLAMRAPGLAVPFLIAGLSGAAGSAAAGLGRPRAARLGMLAGAAGTAASGWLLAPDGLDRGFVIGVGALLAGLLAVFALLATPRGMRHTGSRPE